jgi:preprotein translocase subunit SecG
METVIIVIHLMVIVALVALVLMQRSEGGALGIGGGGNFLSTRSQGNVLTRSTGILAAVFFLTSIALGVLSRFGEKPISILEHVQSEKTPVTAPAGGAPAGTDAAGGKTMLDQLNALKKGGDATPATPATPDTGAAAPAAPAAPATPAGSGGGAAPATPAQPQVPTSQ